MIEILDEINNSYKTVPFLKFAIHPLNGEIINIEEYEKEYITIGKFK